MNEAARADEARRIALSHLEEAAQADLFRDAVPYPGPEQVPWKAIWETCTVVSLARQMYESGDFTTMPILADALQEAGCGENVVLEHCLADKPHIRGCWLLSLVLYKEMRDL